MPAGSQPSLSQLGEFGLIRHLQRRFGQTGPSVLCGMGDDAAIIRPSGDRQWLITTDLLTEEIHFRTSEVDLLDIGYKAAVANLSDIAAMGGTPRYLLVSIAVPRSRRVPDIDRLYQGIMQSCRRHDVQLIGGDTSASKGGFFINLTVIGSVTPGRALRRDGADAGDLLYVTGTLGDSLAGLKLLSRAPRGLSSADRRYLIARHQRPSPRVRAGQVLSSLRLATAAIDISDGLAGDLFRLCERSTMGAVVDAESLPCSRALQAYGHLTGQEPTRLALQGGEDYELLFTVRPRNATRLRRLARRMGSRLSCIGRIRPRREGLRLRDMRGRTMPLIPRSYEHFKHAGVPG